MLCNFRYLFSLIISLSCMFSYGQSGNVVVEYKTNIKIEKNKKIVEKSFLIQINDKESDWISDVAIPYQKDEKLEILEASIINPNGAVVRKLKKKEIITRTDIGRESFYDDNWVKEFKLKWHQYPYRIKYRYRKVCSKFLNVAYWYPFYYSDVPTSKAILQVELPKAYPVKISSSEKLSNNCEVDSLEESYLSTWEINDIEAADREVLAPPYGELTPRVQIIPLKFNYAASGSFESWASMGEWITEINKGLDNLSNEEAMKVDKLIQGITDKKEVIKTLYHYMQDNTRYVNVSLKVGGLKPYPASYVCSNKYGDCKALTMYMKALLKHAGIESFYTLVNAGSNPERIETEIPGQQFNHVILSVPVEGDTLWLENTSSYLPCNYLGGFTQNRYALKVDGSSSKLIRTPSLTSDDVLVNNNYVLDLNEDGNGKVAICKDMKGPGFEAYKYDQVELSEEDQKKEIEKYLPLKNVEGLQWNYSQSDRDHPRMKLDLEMNVKNQFRILGEMMILKPVSSRIFTLEKPDVRENPIRLNRPIHQKDSMVYNLPFMEKYEVKVPSNKTLESKYGQYVASYSKSGNQIAVSTDLLIYSGDYPLEEYEQFYQFIESIKKHHKESVIILNPS